MKLGIPKEIAENEQRVAATPSTVLKLIKLGHEVLIETGAGAAAQFSDEAYKESGATIAKDAKEVFGTADCVLKVREPSDVEMDMLKEGASLISFIWPAQNKDTLDKLASRKATALAIDSVPRISRAQRMDALSSMANIAGYRAVVEAAHNFGRFFTGQVTAAGKVPPAKVMIIGAGVAGLAATGAASSMGAIVRAFDTRPEVREQVESMGAEFLEVDMEEDGTGSGGYAKQMSDEFIRKEMELFTEQAKEVDIIITTALIPGKPAPKLITEEMVKLMRPGSVVVDLAAERGGNCEVTEKDKIVKKHDVTVIGYTDLPSRMATVASELYGMNLVHLLTLMTPEKDGNFVVDMEDQVVRGATVVHKGEVSWPPPEIKRPAPQPAPAKKPAAEPEPEVTGWRKYAGKGVLAAVTVLALFGVGAYAPDTFLTHFTVFVLACFIGWQVIWGVTPSLHTPLMSVTNAISGIIVIGAILHLSHSQSFAVGLISFVAVLVASINVAGGFRVTQRMLDMFRK